jgi:uncharacterized protein (DUF924 family)
VQARRSREILAFWFGGPAGAEWGQRRKAWFRKDPALDAEIRERFRVDMDRAQSGALDDWLEDPEDCLALMLLLDQFPRNAYRNSPAAFSGDARALAAARLAVERGYDARLPPEQRMFVYLPFEHSESLEDQRRCVALVAAYRGLPGYEDVIDYAYRHLRVIERFGRFPHRNGILGRASTAEEREFLREPGSAF